LRRLWREAFAMSSQRIGASRSGAWIGGLGRGPLFTARPQAGPQDLVEFNSESPIY
jgi:hypothetical protein